MADLPAERGPSGTGHDPARGFGAGGACSRHGVYVGRVCPKCVDEVPRPDEPPVAVPGPASEFGTQPPDKSERTELPGPASVSPAEPPASVYDEIAAERVRQDAKWGGVPGTDRRDDHTYAVVLGEEFGEVCKAWLERDVPTLREELVQTAAVAVAWIAELDNGGGLARAR